MIKNDKMMKKKKKKKKKQKLGSLQRTNAEAVAKRVANGRIPAVPSYMDGTKSAYENKSKACFRQSTKKRKISRKNDCNKRTAESVQTKGGKRAREQNRQMQIGNRRGAGRFRKIRKQIEAFFFLSFSLLDEKQLTRRKCGGQSC